MRRARLIEATARRPGDCRDPYAVSPRFGTPADAFCNTPSAQLFRPPCDSSTNMTGVPFLILLPSKPASQFVSRTQPWDSDLLTFEGLGVPWMPYPSAESPIQYDPTGLFGPGLIVNACLDLTPLNL